MERTKPRGWLLLAASAAALMVLAGQADPLAVWIAMAAGAFLAALPGRIRKRKASRRRSGWRGCAACFAGGAVLTLAAGLGDMNGHLLTGLLAGNVSAWAFAGMVVLGALPGAWLAERRRPA